MARWRAWGPPGREALGAVIAIRGEPLDRRRYRELLGLRLQALARLDGPEALRTACARLLQAGLIDAEPGCEQAGAHIAGSRAVIDRLARLGVPGRGLPACIDADSPEAVAALERTDLAAWVAALIDGEPGKARDG